MRSNDDGEGSVSVRVPECCMCGDYGLSSELFRCKDCRFRSQHKYCSNEYPEAESYDICNWCLSKKNDRRKEEINTKFSHNSSSSISHQNQNHDMKMMNKRKRVLGGNHDKGLIKNIKITNSNKIIKNHKKSSPTPDQSTPLAGGRKRIIATDHGGISHDSKRIIRRTRSEDQMSNGGIIIKQVFRNKVRRYKLLDEVSS